MPATVVEVTSQRKRAAAPCSSGGEPLDSGHQSRTSNACGRAPRPANVSASAAWRSERTLTANAPRDSMAAISGDSVRIATSRSGGSADTEHIALTVRPIG